MQKIELFPTVIWKTKIDPSRYDKEKLVATVRENYRRDPYRSAWSNDGTLHHCYNDWTNPKFIPYDIQDLMGVYGQVTQEFVHQLPLHTIPRYNFVFVNVTANRQGQYMGMHDHTDEDVSCACCYSCVHYIKLEPHQPSTTFINPLIVGQYASPTQTIGKYVDASKFENTTYFHKWEIPTEEDDIVIFPSYLKHKVRGDWKQKDPEELRITNAVNINLFKD